MFRRVPARRPHPRRLRRRAIRDEGAPQPPEFLLPAPARPTPSTTPWNPPPPKCPRGPSLRAATENVPSKRCESLPECAVARLSSVRHVSLVFGCLSFPSPSVQTMRFPWKPCQVPVGVFRSSVPIPSRQERRGRVSARRRPIGNPPARPPAYAPALFGVETPMSRAMRRAIICRRNPFGSNQPALKSGLDFSRGDVLFSDPFPKEGDQP